MSESEHQQAKQQLELQRGLEAERRERIAASDAVAHEADASFNKAVRRAR